MSVASFKNVAEYLKSLPQEKKKPIEGMLNAIRKNIPKGFHESIGYGMVGFTVPHSLYPAGYHCDPKQPLPFIGVAAQKNAFTLYHMGLYIDNKLFKWFEGELQKFAGKKPDMGKSCIRFKKAEDIPFELIGQLSGKMTVSDWIQLYEEKLKPAKKKP